MNKIFGEVKQIAFVTRDLERSVRYFLDAWNIGPWFMLRHAPLKRYYKGHPHQYDLSLGIANSGGLQFEIIQQHDAAPSMFQDSLRSNLTSLHVQHMAIWADDFAKTKAEALAKGWKVMQESDPGPSQSCYVVHPSEPSLCLEISSNDPGKAGFRKSIQAIAESWDGNDPIREGLPKL